MNPHDPEPISAPLPDHPDELARLARRLHYEGDDRAALAAFRVDADRYATRTRDWYHKLVGVPAGESLA